MSGINIPLSLLSHPTVILPFPNYSTKDPFWVVVFTVVHWRQSATLKDDGLTVVTFVLLGLRRILGGEGPHPSRCPSPAPWVDKHPDRGQAPDVGVRH